MRWSDIATLYPDAGGATLTGLMTHGARSALGMTAEPRDRKDALRRIAERILTGWNHRDDRASKGALAVLAALEGDWDLVGDATGGALPTRVMIEKTYGEDPIRLVRHLAGVVRSRLPATHALAAITDVRDRFAASDGGLEPRVAVMASQLFVRDIVRAEEPIATTQRWLEGEAIEIEVVRAFQAPADGEDPRVKIFERFAPELSDEAAIARLLQPRIADGSETWARDLEKERMALDDLIICASVARIEPPAGWERLVDPAVLAWLGGESPAIERRFHDLAILRPAGYVVGAWEDALFSLVVGTHDAFLELVGNTKLPKFKPAQFFKDDARKLVRYLASAIAWRGTEADVLPAWFDFLSRRSPVTTPRLTGEAAVLRWKHLLILEAAIARIAGRPRGEVGRALQQHVSGA